MRCLGQDVKLATRLGTPVFLLDSIRNPDDWGAERKFCSSMPESLIARWSRGSFLEWLRRRCRDRLIHGIVSWIFLLEDR